jgi:DegV family protein with EDD domain
VIRIVTDSACDLPPEVLERRRIALVPLTIRFGDEAFADRAEIDSSTFWDRVSGGEKPEIAPPQAEDFRDTFVRLEAEGADGILCLTASGAPGGVHGAAAAAAESFRSGIPIAVVDSGLTSAALGLSAIAGAEAALSMAPLREIEAATRRAASSCRIFVAPDGTSHARRMRRMGPVRSVLSRLLVRHFILTMADGAIVPGGRAKTRDAALDALATELQDLESAPSTVAVVHADAPDVDLLVDRIESVSDTEPLILPMGPALGAVVGPGAVGVATVTAG